MKNFVPTDLQKLAIDAYNGVSKNYDKNDLQDAVRNAVAEACGGEWNYYKFKKNAYDVFAVIAEIMPISMNASLAGRFEQFADFIDTAMGDINHFKVEDEQIYPMFTAARGNGDIERQKLVNRSFSVPTEMKMIKFYDELDRFMAGKMDFAKMTERTVDAMSNYVGLLISDTIMGSYTPVGTPFKSTGAFDATVLNGIIENVKAATGAERLQIWGTTTALSNISDGFGRSDNEVEKANGVGYYGEFRGTDLFAFPQAYRPQSTTFAVNNSNVIILPANEKIVKVAFEGDALVDMKDGMSRNDLQPEILMGRRVGAVAITVPEGKYGFYRFQ